MTLAFLACVEAGPLEAKAILLCESIRRYAGALAHAPIHTFQPRRETAIAPATYEALSQLDVIHHTDLLNHTHHNYAIGNKMFAAAWAEQHVPAELLVFVDTDTFFLNEPAELLLPDGIDAAVRPVDRKRFGSTGPDDEYEPYWQRLYELTSVRACPFVTTAVDGENIRAYFNAGLIAVRRTAGLFSQWLRDFLALDSAAHLPPNGKMQFMDQMALAATLGRAFDRVRILGSRYNYPLPLHPMLPDAARATTLHDLVHVHYHKWFHKLDFLDLLRPPIACHSDVRAWLDRHLPLHPLLHEPMTFRGVEHLVPQDNTRS